MIQIFCINLWDSNPRPLDYKSRYFTNNEFSQKAAFKKNLISDPKSILIWQNQVTLVKKKVTNAWMGWEVPYFLSSNVTSAENGFSFTSMTKGESLEKRGKKCFLFLTEMVANFLKYEEIDTKKSDIQSQQLFSCQTFPIKVKFKRLGY